MIHIERFIDKLAGAEARHNRELVLTIAEARGLHSDITRVLARLEVVTTEKTTSDSEPVTITMTGGSFRD